MNQLENYHRATENEDGNFFVDGATTLSREEFLKLRELQGGSWFIILKADSDFQPHEPRTHFSD